MICRTLRPAHLRPALAASCHSFRSSQIKYFSSSSSVSPQPASGAKVTPKLDFNDPKQSFKTKSLPQLVRGYAVFSLCQTPIIVRNAEKLMKLSYKVVGSSITNFFLRHSFFGHFCAGEDAHLIRPTVKYLHDSGVGSILDYASEADVEEVEASSVPAPSTPSSSPSPAAAAGTGAGGQKQILQCRVYDYKDEALCDQHAETFEKCIRAVHAVSPTGFAAIKCTALGNPKLLEAMSTVIVELRRLFQHFDVEKSGFVTRSQFEKAYHTYFQGGDVQSIFDSLDKDHDDRIDYVEWSNGLAPEDIHLLISHCREQGPLAKAALDENERALVKTMRKRIQNLAELAEQLGVRVMIDAEHTYFQPAIDNITVDLAKRYNNKYPVVFSTYQMYLKDSQHRLQTDLARARKGNYKFAAKLVRGAYMVLERQRALDMGYEDPIHNSIQDTHNNYNSAVRDVIGRIAAGHDIEIMIASHNQGSVEGAIAAMNQHGLGPEAGVYFGQLLGMSDHLSFSLGGSGYKAYKYVPYGKIEEVMPYLIRRAQENSDALGGAAKEIAMIKSEIWRRIFG